MSGGSRSLLPEGLTLVGPLYTEVSGDLDFPLSNSHVSLVHY